MLPNYSYDPEQLQKLMKKEAFEDLTEEDQCVVECTRAILATDSDVCGTATSLTCEVETLSADCEFHIYIYLFSVFTIPSVGTAFSMG
jgi:hypothetical protein